jgi:CRP/FNR family transcriptional regulator, cyclic AMP receptor protein
MKADSMLTRFHGDDGRRRLVDLLKAQIVVGGDAVIAGEIADVAVVRELLPGNILIEQKSTENDLFLILSGTFRVFVNGREVANRQSGQHVGEMVIIDPSLRRTATVIASEQSVVAQVDEKFFSSLADKNPRLWRALAVELCHRLNERRKFHAEPNSKPILFIGSSKEHLTVAETLAAGVPKDIASVTLWSDGVFGASKFPIEDLETQIGIADFAVLVIGPDDRVISRGSESDAPRDNVVFELGLFMGALSRSRTFLLAPRGHKIKIPTDLLGLTTIQFDPSAPNPADMVGPALDELTKIIARMGPK